MLLSLFFLCLLFFSTNAIRVMRLSDDSTTTTTKTTQPSTILTTTYVPPTTKTTHPSTILTTTYVPFTTTYIPPTTLSTTSYVTFPLTKTSWIPPFLTTTYYMRPTTTTTSSYHLPTPSGICSAMDLNKIYDCYVSNVFDYFGIRENVNTFLNSYLDTVQDPDEIPGICRAKRNLDACLGRLTIQRCFNVQDFRRVGFVDSEQEARIMVTNYLQLDYACGSAYDLITDKLSCALKQVGNCYGGYDTCAEADSYINCGIKGVKNGCGNPAGCFIQKYLSLQKCYFLSSCDFCRNINYYYNPVNDMCFDDRNYDTGTAAAYIVINRYVLALLMIFYIVLPS